MGGKERETPQQENERGKLQSIVRAMKKIKQDDL
jgi:hypothetical protein